MRRFRICSPIITFSAATVSVVCIVLLGMLPSPALAQFMSNNFRGDFGVLAGVQPPPGWYVAGGYVNFEADTLRNSDGDRIVLNPNFRGNVSANGYAAGFWRVTDYKIWGGNYSFMAFPAVTDNSYEIPVLGVKGKTNAGVADLYFQPFNLGWHTDRADYTAGIGVVAPTGSYDVNADDNLGLGQWSIEPFAGATWYLNEEREWHFSAIAFYEIHGEKDGTNIRVGDILTLEGGFGRSWLNGALTVGLAFDAQWKITDDRAGPFEPVFDALGLSKQRVYGLGIEATVPIATKSHLIGFVTARYMKDGGARSTLEGDSFLLLASFPIPSVPL